MTGVLDSLPERQRDVFLRRIGVKNGAPETLQEIAVAYGVSRERVRQLEFLAMSHLRKYYLTLDEKVAFMKKWQTASSVKLAAKAAGISYAYALLMSKKLRQEGIPLKRFARGGRVARLTDRARAAVDPVFKERQERHGRFIKLWNAGVRTKDIQEEMGYSAPASVNAMAAHLRGRGLNLIKRGHDRVRKLTNEEFVRVWQSSDSVGDVVDKTGMLKSAVSARACALRLRGVPLKLMAKRERLTPTLIERLKAVAMEALGVR